MNINLSQLTPEETIETRRNTITTKGRTIIIKDKRSSEEILPTSDATLVMKMDTLQVIVPRTNTPSMRIRRDIMLIPPKKMNRQKNIQKREE